MRTQVEVYDRDTDAGERIEQADVPELKEVVILTIMRSDGSGIVAGERR